MVHPKTRVFTLLFAVLLPVAAEDCNHLTADEWNAGWRLLFDGSTTAGWLEVTGRPFPSTCWTIENGCLKAFPNADGMQDIRTVASYRSFELQFEWKLLINGNSGVKYLVQRTDRWQRKGQKDFQARARGPEYQLVDDAGSDATTPARATASLYSALAPKGAAPKPPGEFNQSRIVVRGDHVEHWLNGTKVLEYELTGPEAFSVLRASRGPAGDIVRDSPICLQNHGTPVWFRNLKIRRLETQPPKSKNRTSDRTAHSAPQRR